MATCAEDRASAARLATAYNFGPGEEDARPVRGIADHMARAWGSGASWTLDRPEARRVHEANYLRLDAGRARRELGWCPRLPLEAALDSLVRWYRLQHDGADMHAVSLAEIESYETPQ